MTQIDTSDAVVIERTFAAPIDLVWRMWSDGAEFATWYGPTGAQIPTADIDPTVGGRRRICMQMETPDGTMRMWFGGTHLVVEPPTLLVYTETHTDEHGVPNGGGPDTQVRVELTPVDEGTRMVMTHVGIPAGSPGATGWSLAFDKLTVRLAG